VNRSPEVEKKHLDVGIQLTISSISYGQDSFSHIHVSLRFYAYHLFHLPNPRNIFRAVRRNKPFNQTIVVRRRLPYHRFVGSAEPTISLKFRLIIYLNAQMVFKVTA
jgi:hypothetical protein